MRRLRRTVGPDALCRVRLWLETSSVVDVVAICGFLSLALSLEHLVGPDVEYYGLDPTALQKLLLVASTVPILLRGGLRHWFNPVVVAATILLILGFTLSSRLPGLTVLQSLQTYAALILGVYAFELKLDGRIVFWLIRLLPWTAVANLALAAILGLAIGYPYYRWFFGAFRLSGIGNPAMLSAVALGALLFSLLASLRFPAWVWLAAVNFLIIVWTGTRTRIIEGAILLLGWVVLLAVDAVRESRATPRLQVAVVSLAIPVALLSYSSFAKERISSYATGAQRESISVSASPSGWFSEEDASESEQSDIEGSEDDWSISITTTGRLRAWSYYWDVFLRSPWFGSGLGATVVAGTGDLHPAFRLPHNEYLRLLVDGGFTGLSVLLCGHLLLMLRLIRTAQDRFRRFMLVVAFGVFAAGATVQNELTSLGFSVPFWLFAGILSGELD